MGSPCLREGTLLCSRDQRAEGAGDCRKAVHSMMSSGRYRGSFMAKPSKMSCNPAGLPSLIEKAELSKFYACLAVKNIGKPCAGKPHARFDEGGQGETCSLLYLISS